MEDGFCHKQMKNRLYALEPIGLGTENVECLTSYISRLAEAHSVRVTSLMQYLSGGKRKDVRSDMKYFITKGLNGVSPIAKDYIQLIKNKSGIEGLEYLTTFWLERIIAHKKRLLKDHKSWCPLCYKEMLENKLPIYDTLLFCFTDVLICAKHQIKLVENCPFCGKKSGWLDFYSRQGFCSKCHKFLGVEKNIISIEGILPEERDWLIWANTNISKIMKYAMKLGQGEISLEDNIRALVESNDMTYSDFAQKTNIDLQRLYIWKNGSHKPLLIQLLHFCYSCGITLNDLFFRPNELKILQKVERVRYKAKIDSEVVEEYLHKVYESDGPTPSMVEISQDCNCSRHYLRRHFPQLTSLLIVRRKKQEEEGIKNKNASKYLELERTVLALYEQGIYPSKGALLKLGVPGWYFSRDKEYLNFYQNILLSLCGCGKLYIGLEEVACGSEKENS